MASEVEVCNLALANIRAGSINSLAGTSQQAQICKLKYPFVRDQVLNDLPWQFAHKLKPLELTTDEIFNWANAYQYPADCMQINRLVGPFEETKSDESEVISRLIEEDLRARRELRAQITYEIFNIDDNRVIGTNEPDLRVDYRAEITDPNLFSPPFIMALSHLLASEIAIPIVGAEMGMKLRIDSLQIYTNYIASAMASDMNEQYHPPGDSEFVTTRR